MKSDTTRFATIIAIVLILSGCGIFECNHESEIMFPCPVGPCWCNEGK